MALMFDKISAEGKTEFLPLAMGYVNPQQRHRRSFFGQLRKASKNYLFAQHKNQLMDSLNEPMNLRTKIAFPPFYLQLKVTKQNCDLECPFRVHRKVILSSFSS